MARAKILEIRWHARGGQGAKTAATLLAQVALNEGKYSQGFPDYGPERMGAPIRGYTRISEGEIRVHSAIDTPDVVVVLDDTLLDVVDVCDGIVENGIVIINTTDSADVARSKINLPDDSVPDGSVKVYTLDALQISIDEIGRPMPNTPMIGALIKVTGAVELETVYEDFKKKFLKKLGEKGVQGNIDAIRRAYEEVTEI